MEEEKQCYCCHKCAQEIHQILTTLFQFYGQMKEYLPDDVQDKIMKTLRTQEYDSDKDVLGFQIIASESEAHRSENHKQFSTARKKIPTRSMTEQTRIQLARQVLQGIKRGETSQDMCRKVGLSHRSYQRWRHSVPEYQDELRQKEEKKPYHLGRKTTSIAPSNQQSQMVKDQMSIYRMSKSQQGKLSGENRADE